MIDNISLVSVNTECACAAVSTCYSVKNAVKSDASQCALIISRCNNLAKLFIIKEIHLENFKNVHLLISIATQFSPLRLFISIYFGS